ncbi:MAG: PRC-barrel domain-containing protein [Pseudomonadota bacterium]
MKLETKATVAVLAAITIAATPMTTGAQQSPPRQQAAGGQDGSARQEVARQCLTDLAAFERDLQKDDYWITGWGDRWGRPHAAAAARSAAVPATATVSPWGARTVSGINSPRYQIRILHAAANVLGHRGDQDGCSNVLSELKDLYRQHTQALQEAGIKPGDVRSWRQERIVMAQPIGKLGMPLSVDEVTGTEVRNAKDEWLGTIDDVVLDPQSGNVGFVVLERGGFLGMGEDHVAVPWKALKATRDLNAFVLNVDEQVMENAPTVDPDVAGAPGAFQQQRQKAEQYWQKHVQG